MIGHHFVGSTLRDGSPIPADGTKLVFKGQPILCECGFHASAQPFDAFQYAPGPVLCLVECGGTIIQSDDKLVCTKRTIIARFDATDLLYEAARSWALDVIHLWDAPSVVREYLLSGDHSLRAAAGAAARDAAGAAAWAAARDAAWAARAAARDAAGAAAWAAARDAAWAARAAAWAAARAAGAAWAASGVAAWAARDAAGAARAAALAAQRKQFNEAVEDEFVRMGAL